RDGQDADDDDEHRHHHERVRALERHADEPHHRHSSYPENPLRKDGLWERSVSAAQHGRGARLPMTDATDGNRWVAIGGVKVPTSIYGTAWKEEQTARFTRLALEAGFRGIDTANQRRHYHEAGIGEALREAGQEGIFVQTKFTSVSGQDHRLPYDPNAPVATQVAQSVDSSLRHLGVTTIDSYLLHGPSARDRLTAEDWE